MTTIPEAAIRAVAADLIRAYAAELDHLALAEHLASEDTIGGVLIADLDGPDIDDMLRRILDAAHSATITVSWPAEQPTAEQDGDVRAVAPTLRQEWGVQAEHSAGASTTRTEANARALAAAYSRIREPGCKPTPHYPVTRFTGDWQRLPDVPDAALDARDADGSAS